VGRFNYWSYEFARPEATKLPHAPSAGRIAHARIRKTFRKIRDDAGVAEQYRPRFQEDLIRVGIGHPAPAILALAYYLTTDRLWTQDCEAWTLLAQQLPEVQVALRTWARGVWRRRTTGSWDGLLRTIARDQALFQEISSLGPTQAGLVCTQWLDVPPIWKKYGVSEAVAQRVYRAYYREMSTLLGRGRRVSEKVRALCRTQCGIEVPRVLPTRAMPELADLPADEHVPTIIHWFAHALRNLVPYRQGHTPILWHPTACRQRCFQVQRDLKA
jgi:hypothetical protein